MTAFELLHSLRAQGVALELVDGRLRVRAARGVLTGSVRAELRRHGEELKVLLGSVASVNAGVVPVPRGDPLPLSFAQERLWFLAQLEPDSAEYNVAGGLELRGELDVEALRWALSELVVRHEVLRTRFVTEGGAPVQVIDPPEPVALEIVDLSGLGGEEARAEAERRLECEAARPLDVASDRLIRAVVVRLSPEEHVLGLMLHHIVADEWSIHILRQELSDLYRAHVEGEASPLPPLTVQYADFAVWQRDYLSGQRLDAQLAYWRDRLAGVEPLELPTDRPRPPGRSPSGASVPLALGEEVSTGLRTVARAQGASVFMVLLAGFQALLARVCGTDDVALGTPVANRARPEVEDLVGFFVNTLVLRTDLGGDPTFAELLDRVRETALGAYAHQDLPFERLVEDLAPDRDLSRHPLFQVMLGYEPASVDYDSGIGGLACQGVDLDTGTTNFDLTLALTETEAGLTGRLEYASELFEPASIERLGRYLVALFDQVVANPEARLSELGLIADDERAALLGFSRGPSVDESPVGLVEAVAARVQQRPDAVAVVADGVELTYGDLDARVNRLAHHLQARGVGPEVVVGMCLDRGADLVVCLLAVLKAGGAFLVLDPGYPPERLALMVEVTAAALVLGSGGSAGWVQNRPVIDVVDPQNAAAPAHAPDVTVHPDTLAYVVFTSGSTGTPKGVAVSRGGLANLMLDQARAFGISADERAAQIFSSSFDGSIWDLTMGLGAGATLVVLDPMAGLHQALADHAVTVAAVTPTLLGTLQPDGLETLGTLVCGAERLGSEAVRRWAPGRRMYNAYGPAEASVSVTLAELEPRDDGDSAVPIGRPITNTDCYVLDDVMALVPLGIPGELFIGGTGVARGYVRRPELTAERFVANPYGRPGSRLYRTGDRSRWRTDGQLEFLGRVDEQLKVRGFRVEPGEVETALTAHPDVTEAVVLEQETDSGSQLVAYVCRSPGTVGPTSVELRAFLAERLPGFAIPPSVLVLDGFPRTPNGKLDRAALPLPDPNQRRPDRPYVAPDGPAEELVAAVWEEVLGVERAGALDDFFDLGGHSLLTVRVASAIETRIGIRLPVRLMFESPRLRDWAAVVDAELEKELLSLSEDELEELIADDHPPRPV